MPRDVLDDVGARLTLNRENDCALVVVPAGDKVVFRGADSAADVADADGRSVAISDDQIGILIGIEDLIVGVERIGLARAVERAFCEIDIGLTEDGADVFEVDTACGQCLRIDLHAYGCLLLSPDAHQANAWYLRYLL